MCLINCGLCIKFVLKTVNRYYLRVFVIVIVDPLTNVSNVLAFDISKNMAAKNRPTAKLLTFQFQKRKLTSLVCIYI